MINYIKNLNQQYKDKIIFNLDENTKDIICNVKVDENFWNSVYEELEPKLLELAEDPKYNK